MSQRHGAAELLEFAFALLARAGLDPEKARATAEVLLEGDLLGHNTHGLALLAAYLDDIEKGKMAPTGSRRSSPIFPPRSPGRAGGCPDPGWCAGPSRSPPSAPAAMARARWPSGAAITLPAWRPT
jgi:L-lactate dehydrogenase